MNQKHRRNIDGIAILGSTGIGKTAVAINVAEKISGEVIGLDSRQIYRGFAIGTAQPSRQEQENIPHHLIGVRSPDQDITAGEYAQLVIRISDEIKERGHVPVICGGAGLYYRALTEGIFKESSSFPEIRKRLDEEFDTLGGVELLKRLQELDPDYAQIVHQNNRKRLVRALEIFEGTGTVPTVHFKRQKAGMAQKRTLTLYSTLLTMNRKQLQARIALRTDLMFKQGWVKEVEELLKKFGSMKISPLDSIGYREIRDYLEGRLSMEDLKEEIIIRTRQYAKRQEQWFLRENIDRRIHLTGFDTVEKTSDQIVRWVHEL